MIAGQRLCGRSWRPFRLELEHAAARAGCNLEVSALASGAWLLKAEQARLARRTLHRGLWLVAAALWLDVCTADAHEIPLNRVPFEDMSRLGALHTASNITMLFVAGAEGSGHHWPWGEVFRSRQMRATYRTDFCLVRAFWAASLASTPALRAQGERFIVSRLLRLSKEGLEGTYVMNCSPRSKQPRRLSCVEGVDIPRELFVWRKPSMGGGKEMRALGQLSYPSFGRAELMPDIRILLTAACTAGARVAVAALARHPGELMVSTTLHRGLQGGKPEKQAKVLRLGVQALNSQLLIAMAPAAQAQGSGVSCMHTARVHVFEHRATLASPRAAGLQLATLAGLPAAATVSAFEAVCSPRRQDDGHLNRAGARPGERSMTWRAEATRCNASASWFREVDELIAFFRTSSMAPLHGAGSV